MAEFTTEKELSPDAHSLGSSDKASTKRLAEGSDSEENIKRSRSDVQPEGLEGSDSDNSLPSALLSTNPHIASGVDVRTLSVLSRIYVGSINFELNEMHLKAVFGQFGTIKSVSMSIDPVTMRHKGFCFIEFETPEAASLALEAMNGADLGGRQLKVGRPNNYTAASSIGIPTPRKSQVYVSNINEFITEDNMNSIFGAFGAILKCILLPDLLTRKHKGYGFIEFEDEIAAMTAIQSMNNFEIGGQRLRVSRCIIGGPLGDGMKALDMMPAPPPGATAANDVMSKVNANIESLGLNKKREIAMPVMQGNAAAARAAIAQIAKDQVARIQGTLVDSVAKEENMSINSSQRYVIMQKLAASREELSPVVLVQNAVAVSEVDEGLEEEFSEECSKFGSVVRVKIQKTTDDSKVTSLGGEETGRKAGDGDVKIFVEFSSTESAEKAYKVLDGRWFGGRQLKATALTKADVKNMAF
ncbi:Poly(U)-binding-splicing factor puf60 [Apophysomyces sp. BC1034]|nr:Poly(U)-binding-splicing factor puf60 [Apophysomyces sp. BC1034]